MSTADNTPDDYSVAVHEGGHFLACLHFNIGAEPVVFAPEERPLENPASRNLLAGVCRMAQSGTPYQRSVIGWCGALAEIIAGVPNPTVAPGFPLAANTLREVHSVFIANFGKLSASDAAMIAGYKSHFATLKRAYHILRRQRQKIIRLAKMKCSPTTETAMNQNKPAGLSFELRAQVVQRLLADNPNHPDREAYEKILAHYQRREEPPAELFGKPSGEQLGGVET